MTQSTTAEPPPHKQDKSASQETKKKPDDEMCGECRVINGHLKSCKHYAKWMESKAQDKKTSKATKQIEFMVVSTEEKGKADKRWLEMMVVEAGGSGAEFRLNVWDTALWEYLAPDSRCIGEYSETKKGDRTYCNLEHVTNIDGVAFVNDKPVSDEGEMPPE